ncbi:glycosyltransferase [Niveibacterium sp. 24ML]|uniref:glycosyltransferase family 4 protein n=1 Tax=Niveibacterium sp. 24ML TaxID=2985512 RepID=UPI00226EA85A|nr:glycosyltransferase [Niveibacterium sp. 24ML]MCX9156661.1 glycosyltransferase [Niveibacterium sp. 24ML]
MKRWTVLHESGAPSHYRGLEVALNAGAHSSGVSFLEFHILRQFAKGLVSRNYSAVVRAGKNAAALARLLISGGAGENIVIGMAPFNPRVIWIRIICRNATVLMHSSWPYWDLSFQPHPWRFRFVLRSWESFCKKRVKHVFFVTRFAERNFNESSFAGPSTSVVAHAYDQVAFYCDPRRESQRLRFVFVGRLEKSKGLFHVLALAERFPECSFAVIGDGPLLPELKKAEQRYGNISVCGQVGNRRDLGDLLRNSDVLLLPSIRIPGWEELFGMAIIEAMACGVVPVTTDHRGPTEILSGTGVGLVCSEGDFLEQASAFINILAGNRDVLEHQRRLAVATARDYELSSIANRWLAGVAEVAHEK